MTKWHIKKKKAEWSDIKKNEMRFKEKQTFAKPTGENKNIKKKPNQKSREKE